MTRKLLLILADIFSVSFAIWISLLAAETLTAEIDDGQSPNDN